jgi:hypothetical protein
MGESKIQINLLTETVISIPAQSISQKTSGKSKKSSIFYFPPNSIPHRILVKTKKRTEQNQFKIRERNNSRRDKRKEIKKSEIKK